MKHRVKRLRNLMNKKGLDAVLVTRLFNVRYFSGFIGSEDIDGILLVTKRSVVLITDSRYTLQAKEQAPDARAVITNLKFEALGKEVTKFKINKMGIEGNHITVNMRKALGKYCKGVGFTAFATEIDALRMPKDADEIEAVKAAIKLSETAFKRAAKKLVPGAVELDVAKFFEITQLKLGAEKMAFDTIVASGPRGALPHGLASEKKIKSGELVVFDFGAVLNGYNSDQTMTVPVGKTGKLEKKIYNIVYDAQRKAIEAVRPGITGKELDSVARNVIAEAGYGKYFGHGLGHGVGLEIHEGPRASQLYPGKFEPGMLVTIEPGIYLPGKLGVRLEDIVLVTETGFEVLTTLDKKWKGK